MCDRTQSASGSGRSGTKRLKVVSPEGHGWFFFVPDGAHTANAALAVKLSTSSRGKKPKKPKQKRLRK